MNDATNILGFDVLIGRVEENGGVGLDLQLLISGRRDKRTRRRSFRCLGFYVDEDRAFEIAVDRERELARTSTRLPMVTRLDLYGSTVLRSADMEQLAAEVRDLAGDTHPTYLEPILALAALCSRTPSSELHIDGD